MMLQQTIDESINISPIAKPRNQSCQKSLDSTFQSIDVDSTNSTLTKTSLLSSSTSSLFPQIKDLDSCLGVCTVQAKVLAVRKKKKYIKLIIADLTSAGTLYVLPKYYELVENVRLGLVYMFSNIECFRIKPVYKNTVCIELRKDSQITQDCNDMKSNMNLYSYGWVSGNRYSLYGKVEHSNLHYAVICLADFEYQVKFKVPNCLMINDVVSLIYVRRHSNYYTVDEKSIILIHRDSRNIIETMIDNTN